MTSETRNEAAGRLGVQVRAMTDTLEAYAVGRLAWDGFQKTIGAAFDSERRATLERIRERLVGTLPLSATHLLPWLFAAFDEEEAE